VQQIDSDGNKNCVSAYRRRESLVHDLNWIEQKQIPGNMFRRYSVVAKNLSF
jgi:hypothetical protein